MKFAGSRFWLAMVLLVAAAGSQLRAQGPRLACAAIEKPWTDILLQPQRQPVPYLPHGLCAWQRGPRDTANPGIDHDRPGRLLPLQTQSQRAVFILLWPLGGRANGELRLRRHVLDLGQGCESSACKQSVVSSRTSRQLRRLKERPWTSPHAVSARRFNCDRSLPIAHLF